MKKVPVSTTTSPVTHAAEVAVKNASVHESGFTDSIPTLNNNAVPMIINIPKKMMGKTRGEYENFLNLINNQPILQISERYRDKFKICRWYHSIVCLSIMLKTGSNEPFLNN